MVENPVTSPAPRGPLAAGGVLAPFRYPAFRAIWTANLASNLGSMIQSVAAAWLMTELTRSHALIALVQASVTLPILLFGRDYWERVVNWDALAEEGVIAPQDLNLFSFVETADEAWAHVCGHYAA